MHIMLIDDDETSLQSLVFALEPLGHACETFADPRAAVQAYRDKPCDITITDLRMPGFDGMQVLREIRSISPGAFVIMCTGYGDYETAVTAIKLGAYAFFEKPVKITDLLEVFEMITEEIMEGGTGV